jgi:hypothetical protein
MIPPDDGGFPPPGAAVPMDGTVSGGEIVGVVAGGDGGGVVAGGDGGGVVAEGDGGALEVVPPWIDGGDVCPLMAATSLRCRFLGWSADCVWDAADVSRY